MFKIQTKYEPSLIGPFLTENKLYKKCLKS